MVASLSAAHSQCDLRAGDHITTLNLGRPESTVSAALRLLGIGDGVSIWLRTSAFSLAGG